MDLHTSDGQTLFYETYGDRSGLPVLLLHGLGAEHQMWGPQFTSYPPLGFFLIVPDLRGHGLSSVPEHFSLQDCARDMAELIGKAGLERCNVVGVSMGGLVAQLLACDFPGTVSKLVVVDSFSGVSTWRERANAWLASLLLAVLPTSLQTRLLVTTYSRMGQPIVAAYFEQQLGRMDRQMLRQMRREINRFDILSRLSEIRSPTLVLVGDRFGQTAINMARRTAAGITRSQFTILSGGGDPSNLLAPTAFDEAIQTFLRRGPR
jgi:3-oxoadipate enol-lactonase